MVKFVKIISLPLTIVIFIACNQYLKSEVNETKAVTKHENAEADTSSHNKYSWLTEYNVNQNIVNRISLPEGFTRTKVNKGSFQDWLRHLPLQNSGCDVHLYNGSKKYRQDVHCAIVNIDAGGNEDLQQCADACMRLKAEYHFSVKENENIHFNFTSGHNAEWTKWKDGYRPQIKGNNVTWQKTANEDNSYKNFKSYLKTVFRYAGTFSLSKEMVSVKPEEMNIGDLFIYGGFPGHAVIVLDMAENKSGEKIFIIAQSYMPAQDIHVLKNFNDDGLSPWYSLNFREELKTPEWTFGRDQLKRFK
jgi:hypothetical protein